MEITTTQEPTMTTTRSLIDNETSEDLGPATPAQIEASDAAEQGLIAIDADGNVLRPGQFGWDARRTVWVD